MNTNTFEGSYYIEAASHLSVNKAYLEVDISVCGFEIVTLSKNPIILSLSKN
jgi:hypothetical protein